MTKEVKLIVPDDTVALIVAYQIVDGYKSLSLGQRLIDKESIQNEKTIDINESWEKSRELEE